VVQLVVGQARGRTGHAVEALGQRAHGLVAARADVFQDGGHRLLDARIVARLLAQREHGGTVGGGL
jgi:hypothetical protein